MLSKVLVYASAAALICALPVASFAEDLTAKSAVASKADVGEAKAADTSDQLRESASEFVQRLNYARVALAMTNAPLAKQHITEAQRLLGAIRLSNPEQLQMANVGAGRVTYKDTENKFYYPVQTGPILIEKTKQGPITNREALAVTDAEIAYVTLDFRDNEADKLLAKALQEIDSEDLKGAQTDLGKLMDKVVHTDNSEVSMPLDRARDNIALARSFIVMENYDGARFALKHADKALDEMEKDQRYTSRRDALGTLRQDVAALNKNVQKNDPSTWRKADKKMNEWWTNLKSWASD